MHAEPVTMPRYDTHALGSDSFMAGDWWQKILALTIGTDPTSEYTTYTGQGVYIYGDIFLIAQDSVVVGESASLQSEILLSSFQGIPCASMHCLELEFMHSCGDHL
jgi:hypothetical protein